MKSHYVVHSAHAHDIPTDLELADGTAVTASVKHLIVELVPAVTEHKDSGTVKLVLKATEEAAALFQVGALVAATFSGV